MKKRRRKGEEFSFLRGVVFFLDIVIAFLIISGSWILVRSDFGRASLTFGFLMLVVSLGLKLSRKW